MPLLVINRRVRRRRFLRYNRGMCAEFSFFSLLFSQNLLPFFSRRSCPLFVPLCQRTIFFFSSLSLSDSLTTTRSVNRIIHLSFAFAFDDADVSVRVGGSFIVYHHHHRRRRQSLSLSLFNLTNTVTFPSFEKIQNSHTTKNLKTECLRCERKLKNKAVKPHREFHPRSNRICDS